MHRSDYYHGIGKYKPQCPRQHRVYAKAVYTKTISKVQLIATALIWGIGDSKGNDKLFRVEGLYVLSMKNLKVSLPLELLIDDSMLASRSKQYNRMKHTKLSFKSSYSATKNG